MKKQKCSISAQDVEFAQGDEFQHQDDGYAQFSQCPKFDEMCEVAEVVELKMLFLELFKWFQLKMLLLLKLLV